MTIIGKNFCPHEPTDHHNGIPEYFFNSEKELLCFFAPALAGYTASHPPDIPHRGFGEFKELRGCTRDQMGWSAIKKKIYIGEPFWLHRKYKKSVLALARINYDVPLRGCPTTERMATLRPRRNGKAHLPSKYFYSHDTRTSPSLMAYN